MSFILDALKKAEAERQRQTGPTLLEVRVTQPRRRFPLWTLVIGLLLGVNILLLLVFVLRRPVAPPAAAAATASAAAPAPGSPGPAAAAPATSAAPMAPAAGAVPVPSLQGVSPTDPAAINAAAGAAVPTPTRPANYPSAVATEPVSPGSAELSTTPDVVSRGGIGGGPGGDNPADYEPAVSGNGRAATAGPPRASDGGAHAEPPSLSEIGGDLPSLRLDLNVYSTRPADRYALINMHRVHEGDVLPEGPRVVAIRSDGVELSFRGQDFMLHPQ